MDEFSLINTCFAPLAGDFKGSLNLTDDAAIINIPEGCELAVTTDAVAEGVHFIGNEGPALIARKLLRVNLSDLAAMGARPLCYFLTLSFPQGRESVSNKKMDPRVKPGDDRENWLKRFAQGLAADQKQFHIHLAGGDTISTHGAKTLSITALGTVPKGKALKRSGAKAGDRIYVSGTLGDGALGLHLLIPPSAGGRLGGGHIGQCVTNSCPHPNPPPAGEGDYLIHRYLLPQPRLTLGQKLISLASACMDISDGLAQDLGHICKASGVGATIYRNKLPLSKPAKKLIEKDPTLWDCILGGGDDYELLFTVPPRKKAMVKKLAAQLKLPLTEIGEITKGKDVRVLDETGKILEIKHKGFQHF